MIEPDDLRAIVALGSAAVHAEEFFETGGRAGTFDLAAFKTSMEAAEPLLSRLRDASFLPVKRSERARNPKA